MVLVIRNEAEFLAAHLAYHHAVGVRRAYVFLDRCTDKSAEIARHLNWVMPIERNRDSADRFISQHQTKCMLEAKQMAAAEGFDWLMHVDPDEFACGDGWPMAARTLLPHAVLRHRASLPRMLARVPAAVDQVILRPRDVLPTPQPPATPFWKLHFWQAYGTLPRRILDPQTGEVVRFRQRLGHYKGKAIVRTSADAIPKSAHRWIRPNLDQPAPSVERGFHYHYIVTSANRWLLKHRKFAEYPPTWHKGTKVRFPRQTWKEASVTMDAAQAQAYFDRWVAVQPRHLLPRRLIGSVVRDTFVEDVLRAEGIING